MKPFHWHRMMHKPLLTLSMKQTLILLVIISPMSALMRFKKFANYANGVIDNQNTSTSTVMVKTTRSAIACGAWCKQQIVCNAFSFKKMDSGDGFECRVVSGSFTWSADPGAKFMSEDIGDIRNYTYAHDGMFYKIFPTAMVNMAGARTQCQDQEQGDIPVPYPIVHYNAIIGIPGTTSQSYWLGLTRTGTQVEGRWITDDGTVFNAYNKSSDTDQKWAPNEPNGSSDVGIMIWDGLTWDDLGWNDGSRRYMCRRETMYRKSPVNGKYYRAYNRRATNAEAAAACEADGGSLANVVSELDWNATEHFRFRNRYLHWSWGFWIAGSDAVNEGVWEFPDGTRLNTSERNTDPTQLRFFSPGEPNMGAQENCLLLSQYGALDISCESQYRFMCQIQLT